MRDGVQKSIEVIARALLVSDGRVLLCRDVEHGHWYLPGGHVEPGEPAAAAVARELSEECGITIDVGPCVLIHEHLFDQRGRPRHEYSLVFHVERPPHEPIVSREPAIEFAWHSAEELARLDLKPSAHRDWLMETLPGGVVHTVRFVDHDGTGRSAL